MLVSTFHIVRLEIGATWKMPTLDSFIHPLMHEKDKIIKMGTLKIFKVHGLVVHEKGNEPSKSNQKGKGKNDPDPRMGGNSKPLD